MKTYREILSEETLIDSKVAQLLADRVSETTKGGGKVAARIKKNSISVVLGHNPGKHVFAGTYSNGKWKKAYAEGVAVPFVKNKTISDEDAVKAITSIFDEAKTYKQQ